MKKVIFFALMAVLSFLAVAQTHNLLIYKGGAVTDRIPTEQIGYIKINTVTEFEYVDLGLPSGLKWAKYNIGASAPEEYGCYFSWGEIAPKTIYTPETCTTHKKSLTLNDVVGNPLYDAAAANWGGKWRLPSHTDLNELISNCTWTWDSTRKGYTVKGPNGNSIFLPAAGVKMYSKTIDAGNVGEYWTATPHEATSKITEDKMAHFLLFYCTDASKKGHYRTFLYRSVGKPIRPVCE